MREPFLQNECIFVAVRLNALHLRKSTVLSFAPFFFPRSTARKNDAICSLSEKFFKSISLEILPASITLFINMSPPFLIALYNENKLLKKCSNSFLDMKNVQNLNNSSFSIKNRKIIDLKRKIL